MLRNFLKLSGILLTVTLVFSGAAFADADEVTQLKDQIKSLNDKIAQLERRTSTMEGHVAASPGKEQVTHVIPSGEVVEGGLIHTMQDIHMAGFIDTQWNNNFRQPKGVVGTNTFRTFDTDDGSFTVNAVELDFSKEANPEGGAGFRTDIMMGEDAEVIDGATFGSDADEFAIQQAYIEAVAPLKFWEGNTALPSSVKVQVGRFVTLAGAEVIESKDNWNISRSLGFQLGEPLTHTGIRTNFKLLNEKLDTYLGINNGWDNVVDNNSYKTLEVGAGYSPLEHVSLFHSLYWGPENANQNSHRRFLSSNVVKWDVTDKLALMYNFDFGSQRRVPDSATTDGRQNAQWYENAIYARYQVTEKFAMAYRFEIFIDQDVFRTAGVPIAGFGSDRTWEQTITAEYEIYDNLIGRLEFRFDKSNDDDPFAFEATQTNLRGGEDSQATLGAQLLYSFA